MHVSTFPMLSPSTYSFQRAGTVTFPFKCDHGALSVLIMNAIVKRYELGRGMTPVKIWVRAAAGLLK